MSMSITSTEVGRVGKQLRNATQAGVKRGRGRMRKARKHFRVFEWNPVNSSYKDPQFGYLVIVYWITTIYEDEGKIYGCHFMEIFCCVAFERDGIGMTRKIVRGLDEDGEERERRGEGRGKG